MSALAKKDVEGDVLAKSALQTVTEALQGLLDSRGTIIHDTYEAQEDLKAFKKHEIPDQETLDATQAVTAELKAKLKYVQYRKEQATKPLNALLKIVHEIYRPLLTSLEDGETELKNKMAKALKRMRDEQTKALSAVAAATRVGDMAAAKVALGKMPDAAMPKNMSIREIWRFRVKDITLIEDQYLMVAVNDAAVQAAIDAGKREIPGFEIYNDDSVTIRQEKK